MTIKNIKRRCASCAYKDDACVVRLTVSKHYGEEADVLVMLWDEETDK